MKYRTWIAAALLPTLGHAVAAETGDAAAPVVERYKVLSKATPEWPGDINREAVVVLRFDLLATGKVGNIEVLDGFYEKRFVDAAVQAAKQIRFQPTRVDGKAVDQCVTQVFRFTLPGTKKGVTQEFQYELRKVGKLLDQKDYAGANFHAEWMLSGVVKLNYEYALLQAQLAETFAAVGRIPEALDKAVRATARSIAPPEFLQVQDTVPPNNASAYLLPRDLTVNLLELRMKLQAKQGLYQDALQSYYELAGLEAPKPADPRTALATQLKDIIQGRKTLRGKIEMGGHQSWRVNLSRRRFALDNVQGVVKQLFLRCSASPPAELEYRLRETFDVPAAWGTCNATVVAEPGTRFEVVEFPDLQPADPMP